MASHFNFHENRSAMMALAASVIISAYMCLSLVVYGVNAVVRATGKLLRVCKLHQLYITYNSVTRALMSE